MRFSIAWLIDLVVPRAVWPAVAVPRVVWRPLHAGDSVDGISPLRYLRWRAMQPTRQPQACRRQCQDGRARVENPVPILVCGCFSQCSDMMRYGRNLYLTTL